MTDDDARGRMTDPATATTSPGARRPTGTRRPPLDPATRRTPPPRPQVTRDLAPPVPAPDAQRPRAATISAVLWFAACAAGVFGLVAVMMDGTALRANLKAAALEADPSASAQLVDDGVRTTILFVLGVVALLLVATLAGTVLLL